MKLYGRTRDSHAPAFFHIADAFLESAQAEHPLMRSRIKMICRTRYTALADWLPVPDEVVHSAGKVMSLAEQTLWGDSRDDD
jgi:hypothetical protein